MADLDPELTRPELSCRLVASFLPQVEDEFGADTVHRVLADAGLPEPFVRNPRHWVSIRYVNGLMRGLARHGYGLPGVPDAYDHPFWAFWHRNGRRSLDPSTFGVLFSALRALGSPAGVLRNLSRLTRAGNPQLQVDVREDQGQFRIAVRYDRDELPRAGICWNMQGILEGIPLVWGLPSSRVHHPTCAPRDGADRCVYELRPASVRSRERLIGAVAVGLGAACGAVVANLAGLPWATGMIGAAGWATAGLVGQRHLDLARASTQDGLRALELLGAADQRAADLWDEGQRLRRSLLAAKKLSGYLAVDLVDRILENPEQELALGGRLTQAAVLFADIVGFTPRCEGVDPAEVVEELNLYFSRVDPALCERGGVVDKRIGDGIMAVFPAREGEPAPGQRAVEAGLAMQRAMDGVNRELARRGSPPMTIRVGVAAGPLVQGNMGSPARLEYTVIGDTVNTAARLEGQARPGRVLALRTCLERLDDYPVVDSRTIRVKGRREPLEVVELAPHES